MRHIAWARALLLAITATLCVTPAAASWWPDPVMSYCKCICFGTNSTVLVLHNPTDPARPCLSCTRQYCVDQKLPICKGAYKCSCGSQAKASTVSAGVEWSSELGARISDRLRLRPPPSQSQSLPDILDPPLRSTLYQEKLTPRRPSPRNRQGHGHRHRG
jgi:hypothetical protein